MKVLVTGATGFVGLRLLSHLREAGMSPVALVRKTSRTQKIKAQDFPLTVGDLATGEGLEEALSGAEAVVHCAGGGRVKRIADFYTNNTETTKTLLQAIARSCPALKRFVLVSSIAARGPGSTEKALGAQSHYGKSKAHAEAETLCYAKHFPVTILRPPSLYGPGDTRFLPLFKAVKRGFVTLPSSQTEASFLHVDDMCQAIVSILRTTSPTGQIYEIDDGNTHTLDAFIQAIQDALGTRGPRILRIPTPVLHPMALGIEALARLRGQPALLTRDKLRDLAHSCWKTNAATFRQEVGWQPRYTLEKGIAETARWYALNDWKS